MNAKLRKIELVFLKGRILKKRLRQHEIQRGKHTKTTRQKEYESESQKTKKVKKQVTTYNKMELSSVISRGKNA